MMNLSVVPRVLRPEYRFLNHSIGIGAITMNVISRIAPELLETGATPEQRSVTRADE